MIQWLRFRTLQHQVIFWPVLCSVAIMLGGGLLMLQSVNGRLVGYRNKEFENFASIAKSALDSELRGVYDDLSDWATRWNLLVLHRGWHDSGGREELRELSDWALAFRPDQKAKYDLLLFVDSQSMVRFAKSMKVTDQARLQAFENARVSDVLPLPPDWLESVVRTGKPAGRPVAPIAVVNALADRPLQPAARDQVPAHYQFVLAVPAVVSSTGGAPIVSGAVVGVVSWVSFQRALDQIEEQCTRLGFRSGYAYLIDVDANTVIGHRYRNPATHNYYGTNLTRDHQLSQLAARLQSDPSGRVQYPLYGTMKFAILHQVSVPNDALKDVFGWRLGVGLDEKDVLEPTRALTAWFAMMAVVAALAVCIASYFVSRRIRVSVQQLSKLTRDAAAGRDSFIAHAESHDEISELTNAIGELAVKFRTKVGFRPLPNPYVVGTPIHSEQMFFGRHDDVAWIGDHLRQEGNEIILLIGQRRIGKTSLLHHVARKRAELNILPFFIDTQVILHTIANDMSFYQTLLEEMLAQLADIAPTLPHPVLGEIGSPESFDRFVKFLNTQVPGAVPVCLFDEIENLDIKFKDGTLSTDVIKFLAGVLDGRRTISFIATGSDRLDKRRGKHWNVLLLKSVRRRLGVLSEADGRRMLTDPLHGEMAYDDSVQDRILRLTGNHPYYTQDVCQRMVNELNVRQTNRVTTEVFEEVLNQILQNPPPTLEFFWDSLRPATRIALSALAAELASDADRTLLETSFRRLPPSLLEEVRSQRGVLNGSLSELVASDWLAGSLADGYHFRVDLFRCWIRREHPIAQVETEILVELAGGVLS